MSLPSHSGLYRMLHAFVPIWCNVGHELEATCSLCCATAPIYYWCRDGSLVCHVMVVSLTLALALTGIVSLMYPSGG